MNTKNEPFSFLELNANPQLEIIPYNKFKVSDNINLAYYEYSVDDPDQVLVFIHGGGACSSLGYQYLADTLSKAYKTKVYLLDIRGHGISDGIRGDAPTKERIWQDISEFLEYVKELNSKVGIFLGGHSSGGGLVLNYSTWKSHVNIDGYIFISPKLGYKSNTDRYPYSADPFAEANILTMLINKLSFETINGHAIAVKLNYSQEIKKSAPLLVESYTCTVVNAITPESPEHQFSNIDKPFCIFIGEKDELIIPEKTIEYYTYSKSEIKKYSIAEIIKNQKHLGILRNAGDLIGGYFYKLNTAF
jgi:pimeloyl-ACP methyl ester carboxylesterase